MSEKASTENKSRRTRRKDEDVSPSSPSTQNIRAKAEKIKKDADELVDEIDYVLENNAEEFVKDFRQQGGE